MTARTRAALEPAYILHHYPYRDSSLLLEVFSGHYGRIGLVARGARSAKARWRGQLQTFTPLLLSWNMRGDLGTLTGVDDRVSVSLLAGKALFSAYYLNELLLRLLSRHDPHPELFTAYRQALEDLALDAEPALRIFEKRLLQALGYGLLLDRDAESDRPVEDALLYEYRLESGPVRCDNARQAGLCLRGSSLRALQQENLVDPVACREVKRLMRAALSLYLGSRPLRTREVLRQFSTFNTAGRESGCPGDINR